MNKMEKKHPRDWSPTEWRDSIKDGWFAGLPDGVIERCPSRVVKDKYVYRNAVTLYNLLT
jgi:hypothetical protein